MIYGEGNWVHDCNYHMFMYVWLLGGFCEMQSIYSWHNVVYPMIGTCTQVIIFLSRNKTSDGDEWYGEVDFQY